VEHFRVFGEPFLLAQKSEKPKWLDEHPMKNKKGDLEISKI
jgi:hypothetical protein